MIKVENISVHGFDSAVRAMRHPMQSYDRSDSYWLNDVPGVKFEIGPNDLDLMRRLYKAGAEHRTYARMIYCTMEIEAPMYWWKEADRYSVGKCQVSTSTMHKIHAKVFTQEDFSCEHLLPLSYRTLNNTIHTLNMWREIYINGGKVSRFDDDYYKPKDKTVWQQMIQLLPSSYNQRRTVSMSYEVVFKIIKERTGHKLDEWNEFVEILRKLPYIEEIMRE